MSNNTKDLVYGKIHDKEIVSSTSSSTRTYIVTLQDVAWGRNGQFVPVVYVAVAYDNAPQIYEHKVVPHFLLQPGEDGKSDFINVIEAMQRMKTRHGLI